MKTKNVVLGLAALLLAVGSAFGSLTRIVAPDYISVQYLGDETFTCKQITQACDEIGQVACEVTVQTTSGGKRAQVYDDPACATPLTDSHPNLGEDEDERDIIAVAPPIN